MTVEVFPTPEEALAAALAGDVDVAQVRDGFSPQTNVVRRDGERGVLVLTHLDKQACPLVRWWTGDMVVRDSKVAPDGRTHARLAGGVMGRSDDMLIIRGVNVFPTQIEEQILRDPRLAGIYQINLSRDGHLDNVEVQCELQRDLTA